MRLLLDENLSPLTAEFLRDMLGYEVRRISSKTEGKRLEDEEVSDLTQEEGRFILTFDLGDHFFSCRFTPPAVIVLRLRDQRPESVNVVLGRFFTRYSQAEEFRGKLFMVAEGKTRVRRKP